MRSRIVPAEQAGIRLDAFVRRLVPHLSRREAEKAMDEKFFMIDGKPGKKGERLAAGAVVSFVGPEPWLSEGPLPNGQLRVSIVYEDSHLLIVRKPAGMDTHGFSGRDTETLANFLAAERPDLLTVGASRWEPGLVHRLDRETSGLVLIAKTQRAFELLRLQFRRRQIKKSYWALVWGVTAAQGTISYPLVHDTRDNRRMQAILNPEKRMTKQRSWKALTRFRKLNDAQGVSLLEIEMETGVTHQIRVHLASIGHPIVGDSLYGAEHLEAFALQRHFLHACRLELQHPQTGRPVRAEAGLPDDLRGVLENLKLEL
jgi:23S rRNA pseudouridine1911/1915/1917 synthase